VRPEPARVLVVEDHRETSGLLRALLEAEGWEVQSVTTGEAAFRSLEVAPDIDLIVLDLMLPGMSGYEVLERLRAEADLCRIPILIVSALTSPSARLRGFREGADDYVTKPFLPEELVARARTLVTARLLERRTREIEALERLARATLAAPGLDALLERVAATLVDVFEADAGLVLLRDAAGALVVRGAAGAADAVARARVAVGAGLAGRAVATGEGVLVVDDLATDPRAAGDALRVETFRAAMAAPLRVGATAIGALEVARRGRRLDPRAGRLLGLVADRAALGVEHARLAGEARELADVVRRIGEGVVVADAADRIVFANPAFHAMVGAAEGALAGVAWPTLLGAPPDPALAARLGAPAFEGELLLLTRTGDPRPVHLAVSTVDGPGGRRRIAVFRDVSREHELRFRVIREQKVRTLGALAAGVAHNLNNRLTPVIGWTEMLLERLEAGEALDAGELAHALRVIHQGACDGVATVRRLQEYSRPPRFRGPELVQLREIVEQLLALTRPQWDTEAARRGVRYEIDLRAGPAPPVLAVASELREALLNLIENALAAMPEGGRLTIEVGDGGDGRAVLTVADTGRGMSPEVQRLAFEPFFTTRAAEGGTGLGLALAQEIVHRYGGTIALRSQEGVGTTFTLSFPAAQPVGGPEAVFLPVLAPLRVLAVEDEPEVLDLLRAMLAHAGHAVFGAASGREALALYEREPVDVVITDLGMPGMTGRALAAELKRRRPVPVVLLTGWADELDAAAVPEVDAVLPKPFTRERLFHALARAVPDRVRPA